jgi:hypothetical protein
MRPFNSLASLRDTKACLTFMSLLLSFPVFALDIRSMIFDISKIALENEISVTSISNEEGFIKIKGPVYPKGVVEVFSNRLLYAHDMAIHQLSDAVSFLEKDEFLIVLRPKVDSLARKDQYVTFTSPTPRERISKDTVIKGQCSREGAEVVINGDFEGKALCVQGAWQFKVPLLQSSEGDFIHLWASQRMMNQEIIKDYRTFRIP